MTQRLLKSIAAMCISFILGMANWILMPLASQWWLMVLNAAASAFSFYATWRCYKKAKIIATIIDLELSQFREVTDMIISILNTKVESPTDSLVSLYNQPKAGERETEDEGHPV